MTPDELYPEDEWRLGDPAARAPEATAAAAEANLSHARLTRPVYVMTAEHLCWLMVAGYALASRTMALGARPLDAGPARSALIEYGIAQGGLIAMRTRPGPFFSWPQILQGWVFANFGASDASARVTVALCALLLIAAAYAMRPYLGRAGALGFGVILTLSPTLTYFSRGGYTAIASIAFMMSAIAIAASMHRRPNGMRGIGLGCAVALWLSANPIGYATAAIMIVSLIMIGIFDAVTIDHPRLRMRVWWERRRAVVVVTAMVTLLVWWWLATGLLSYSLPSGLRAAFHEAFDIHEIGFARGVTAFAPILGFYEFAVVMLAIAGMIAIAGRWIRSRFAVWTLIWTLLSIALTLAFGIKRPETTTAIVVPCAMLAGFGVEWIHASARWSTARYALAAILWLTLYAQVLTNYIYGAPDTSEAPWARHALLYWSEPATAIQTQRQSVRAVDQISVEKAYAAMPKDSPQAQWYFRSLGSAQAPDAANVVVSIGETRKGSEPGDSDQNKFGFEESWKPEFERMSAAAALRYFFTQRPWSEVEIRDLLIEVRQPSGPPAPTVIVAPAPSPSATATATDTPSPGASATPEASATATATVTATPTATVTATASASPEPTPTSEPSATPTAKKRRRSKPSPSATAIAPTPTP